MASIVERIDLDGASNVMRVLIRLTAPFSRLSGHIELETKASRKSEVTFESVAHAFEIADLYMPLLAEKVLTI